MAEVFGTGWRQRVFCTTTAYDLVAPELIQAANREVMQGIRWGMISLSALVAGINYNTWVLYPTSCI
jgi:hypothetical protein